MCTSLIYRNPERKLLGLGFNRDESIKRKPADPPHIYEENGIKVLAPADGDQGGTWIGINSDGEIYALLNLYEAQLKLIQYPTSRGFLVRRLLEKKYSISEINEKSLEKYYPFRLVRAGAEKTEIFSWNGEYTETWEDSSEWLVLGSSFMLGAEAEKIRRQNFEENYKNQHTDFFSAAAAFLTSHLPEKGPKSPCMHRRDAHTVSQTLILKSEKETVMKYKSMQPCETEVFEEFAF